MVGAAVGQRCTSNVIYLFLLDFDLLQFRDFVYNSASKDVINHFCYLYLYIREIPLKISMLFLHYSEVLAD